MNKLVSKNPVQRFKQGKKIVKAQFGNIIQIDSENDIWQDKSTGKRLYRIWISLRLPKYEINTLKLVEVELREVGKDRI